MQILDYWPLGLMAAGGVLLLWNSKGAIVQAVRRVFAKEGATDGPTFEERLAAWKLLRDWCDAKGFVSSVNVLEQEVLKALVREKEEP